ncbi:MAG: hypothetical protein QXG35_00445 [Nitrososphaerota archaeon]
MSAMKETAEAGIRLRPEAVALLEYIEKEVIRERILPLEERMKRLEDRLDYYVSQFVSDIAKNVVTASYGLITGELKDALANEVKQAVITELSSYSRKMDALVTELEVTVEAMKSLPKLIEDKFMKLDERIHRMEPTLKVDAKSLASELKPALSEEVAKVIEDRLSGVLGRIEPRAEHISTKMREIGDALEALFQRMMSAADALEKLLATVEQGTRRTGLIEVEREEQELPSPEEEEYGEYEEGR